MIDSLLGHNRLTVGMNGHDIDDPLMIYVKRTVNASTSQYNYQMKNTHDQTSQRKKDNAVFTTLRGFAAEGNVIMINAFFLVHLL